MPAVEAGDGSTDWRHFTTCVLGVYASFLAWGWLQERLTTTVYDSAGDGSGGAFAFITFLNVSTLHPLQRPRTEYPGMRTVSQD